jgi:hypothetical protein
VAKNGGMDDAGDRAWRASALMKGLGKILPPNQVGQPDHEITHADLGPVKSEVALQENPDGEDAAPQQQPGQWATLPNQGTVVREYRNPVHS